VKCIGTGGEKEKGEFNLCGGYMVEKQVCGDPFTLGWKREGKGEIDIPTLLT